MKFGMRTYGATKAWPGHMSYRRTHAGQTIQMKWLQNTGPQIWEHKKWKKTIGTANRFGVVKAKYLKVHHSGYLIRS